MKKQIISEQRVCDVEGCGKWVCDSCLGCGIDLCYDHQKELAVEYHYSAQYGGYGDGYYCHECDKKLRASGDDPLHSAYLKVAALAEEGEAFHRDFEARSKKLELRTRALHDKRQKALSERK